jgi:hypothetical protein
MKRFRFEIRHEIATPVEVEAYSEKDARERILRRNGAVISFDDTASDYQIIFVRCVDE